MYLRNKPIGGDFAVTMPELLVRIAKMRKRLNDTDNPVKRLKISRELDRLLNNYYRLKMDNQIIL